MWNDLPPNFLLIDLLVHSSTSDVTSVLRQDKGPECLTGVKWHIDKVIGTKTEDVEDSPSSTGLDWSSCSFTLFTSWPFPHTAATYDITNLLASEKQTTEEWGQGSSRWDLTPKIPFTSTLPILQGANAFTTLTWEPKLPHSSKANYEISCLKSWYYSLWRDDRTTLI